MIKFIKKFFGRRNRGDNFDVSVLLAPILEIPEPENILEKWASDETYRNHCISQISKHSTDPGSQAWIEQFESWMGRGCPENPPELLKWMTLEAYKHKYNIDVLIETGTATACAAYYNKDNFSDIYTIEIDSNLHLHNRAVLSNRPGRANVHLLLGSSLANLPGILENLTEPALFWLDANHEATLRNELAQIECHTIKNHVILIDDHRLFGSTVNNISIADIENFAKRNNYEFNILYDSIRLVPKCITHI